MPEFLTLLPPDEAREKLFSHLPAPEPASEIIDVSASLGRVTAEDVTAPHPLPDFRRSTVDGFAVHAKDTYGASDSLPAYLESGWRSADGRCAQICAGAGAVHDHPYRWHAARRRGCGRHVGIHPNR